MVQGDEPRSLRYHSHGIAALPGVSGGACSISFSSSIELGSAAEPHRASLRAMIVAGHFKVVTKLSSGDGKGPQMLSFTLSGGFGIVSSVSALNQA